MKSYPKIPFSRSIARLTIVLLAVLMAAAAPISIASKAYADQYDERIKALQAEISQYQNQANSLKNQATNLQVELSRLANDKTIIQGQIDLSQAKYDQLQQQITQTSRKIQTNKDALGATIANLYVDGKISPLEMIASSKNVSDYLDKQEYRNSVRDQLTQTIKTIKTLKAQLSQQQTDIQRTLTDSKNSRQALTDKENEQQTLLTKTNGQESAYQQLAAGKQAETDKLVRDQIAFNMVAAQNSGSQTLISAVAGGGGYPGAWANAPQDTVTDNWNLFNRECVSYVAWKIASTGRFVPNFNGQGNANQWEGYVSQYGIKAGSTPVVGSAAVLYGGAYGHVMYVEAVTDGGSRIIISEYNYGWSGKYSKRSISSAGLTYLYF